MGRMADDLSSLVGHALPPERQRDRLHVSMRWQASRVFLLACAQIFVPVALLLWFTREPHEWQGGWLPPAFALLIAALALLRLALLSRMPKQQEPWLALGMLALVMSLPVLVSVSRDLGLWRRRRPARDRKSFARRCRRPLRPDRQGPFGR